MISMCTYRVKPGKEEEFESLLERHWTVLREAGLATDEPSAVYRGYPEEQNELGEKGPFFVELITWKSPSGPERAHELPAVAAIWEPMGLLCEDRNGRPAMEFPHVEKLDLRRDR